MLKYILVLSISLCINNISHSQTDSLKRKAIGIGVDSFMGFDKPKELISNVKPEYLRLNSFGTPKITFSYSQPKIFITASIGYGFIRSAKTDTLINNRFHSYITKPKE